MNRRQALVAFGVTPWALERKARGWVIPVVCGILVVGVGVWLAYEIYQMCKKIDQPKPDDVADPNAPPPNKANFLQPKPGEVPKQTMKLTDSSGVLYYDATPYGFYDCNQELVTAIMQTRLQSTGDFRTWTDELKMVGYCAASGITVVFTRAGVEIGTIYLAGGATSAFDLNQGGIMAPHKFYRLASP